MLSLFYFLLLVVYVSRGLAAELNWSFADDKTALCNDFTLAGFFHRPPSLPGEDKWVVFLESGSLCYSNYTCNRLYFQSSIRSRFSRDDDSFISSQLPFGNFDTEFAWRSTAGDGQPLTEVVNPLMMSLHCFRNETQFFSDSETLSVKGRDILSSDCRENPTFCNHGHVLVPYCSSDLWLGSDNRMEGTPCECWDQTCFQYNPTSQDMQFIFRGEVILQSVFKTLDRLYDIQRVSEIVFVGSSTGGVGVLNSVNWVRQTFKNVSLKVITDSSWFINFQDSLTQLYGADTTTELRWHENNILQFLESNEACNNTRFGYPCCLSAPCLLQESGLESGETYYPQAVPLFVLSSLYDIYLLSDSLSRLLDDIMDSSLPEVRHTNNLISLVGEFGGATNTSLLSTAAFALWKQISFTYFSPQCLHHRYLTASSLVESGGLLSSEVLDYSQDITFQHTVKSTLWNARVQGYYDGDGYTIRDAINYWYWNVSDESEGVAFRDICSTLHCSNSCPDQISVLETEVDMWSVADQAVVDSAVLLIIIICLTLKICFIVWYRVLKRKQRKFLHSFSEEDSLEMDFELPTLTDDYAISVACLDLHYSVRVKISKVKEKNVPVALGDLLDEDAHSKPENNYGHIQEERKNKWFHSKQKKKILNGISAYFNPGEMVAIMGPSGSGKTVLLDFLAGRSNLSSNEDGQIFINGLPMEECRKWYIDNMGYVHQLERAYYEELTVRENLTLVAWMKLNSLSTREKFERVELVMESLGLIDIADTVVGGYTGPGLSGGQKQRLLVALKLLKLPSVLFLDEPTSGLDSASSTQLLCHLNDVAASNRAVVVALHQPRLEIFHMFHRIVVLTDGKVAYHGVPEKAYEVFVSSLQSFYLQQQLIITDLEDRNPADVIMDMLGNVTMRRVILNYYEDHGESELVRRAIALARRTERYATMSPLEGSSLKSFTTFYKCHEHFSFVRLAVLETREMTRARLITVLYFSVFFICYGLFVGTLFLRTTDPFNVLRGLWLFSLASALFVFPAMYIFYTPALKMYAHEHAEGIRQATDLVIQPFVRFISITFIPFVLYAGILYSILIEVSRQNALEFFQLLLVNLALNQTWIALFILLIIAFQRVSLILCPILLGLAAFTLIPLNRTPLVYRLLSYINPLYYGLSASAVITLSDFESDCIRDGGSELDCYTTSGDYALAVYDLSGVNPYQNTLILLSMTVFFLVMAGLSLWFKYFRLKEKLSLILRKWVKRKAKLDNVEIQLRKIDDRAEELSVVEGSTTSSTGEAKSITERDTAPYLNDDQNYIVWTRETADILREEEENEDQREGKKKQGIVERQKRLQSMVFAAQQKFYMRRMEHEECGSDHQTTFYDMEDNDDLGNIVDEPSSSSTHSHEQIATAGECVEEEGGNAEIKSRVRRPMAMPQNTVQQFMLTGFKQNKKRFQV